MSRTCIGYEMCQCKTMSGTWHQHRYVRASVRPCLVSASISIVNVRPCLGHGIDIIPYI
ncbi:hypothetical protein F383_30213 [Gossypium arboreum]|uniref:Uncharacterized protein n=1 Tax=Gossypium arboreum TaxID=29729 RepID=A0A0B0P6Y3_GOSAR|nr:hypothetical protein F383_30213 [Gossypium arboreum]